MKKIITLSILIYLFTACSTTTKLPDQASGITPDGLSIGNAIIINEKSSFEGISAEWEWLKQNYPGFKFNGQSLLENNDTFYDKMDIITRDGQSISIYFDKSNYFKKD